MALDGKTIIKEEITEKDAYEVASSNNSSRRNKGSYYDPLISRLRILLKFNLQYNFLNEFLNKYVYYVRYSLRYIG